MALSGRLGRQITDAPAKPFPISLFLSQPLGGTHPLGLQPGYAAKYLGDLLGQQCPLSVAGGTGVRTETGPAKKRGLKNTVASRTGDSLQHFEQRAAARPGTSQGFSG